MGCSLGAFYDVFDQLASWHGILPCFLLSDVTFDVSVLKEPRGFAFAYVQNGANLIEGEDFGIVAKCKNSNPFTSATKKASTITYLLFLLLNFKSIKKGFERERKKTAATYCF